MSISSSNDKNRQQQQPAVTRRERVKAGLATIGSALQKINLVKLIDDMEHDQELANDLEYVNQEIQEEAERKQFMQEALAKCKAEIEDHLSSFLLLQPFGSYEEWIQDLHPENVDRGKLLPDLMNVDLRFYVVDSDHRLLWNERVPDRQVPARTYKLQPGEIEAVDLLSSIHSSNNNSINGYNDGSVDAIFGPSGGAGSSEDLLVPPPTTCYNSNNSNTNGQGAETNQAIDFLS